jgi:SAM-dependent methyltransferase
MSGHDFSEWAGDTGNRWREHIDRFEGMLTEIGDAIVAHAGFAPGERVADVGCGCGPTTFAIAQTVGSEGHVAGLDVAPQLIALAEDRAQETGLSNVSFEVLNCETGTPAGAPFDRLFSRFGVMFFGDSTAAFANMRSWLKSGGRMDIAAWGAPSENPWFGGVGGVMASHFDMPPPEPDAPGPFRFGDAEATTAMLEAAGFSDVTVTEHRADQPFGGPGSTPAEAVDFVLRALGMQDLLNEASPEKQAAVKADLEAMFAAHHSDAGIMMPGCSLFYSARA